MLGIYFITFRETLEAILIISIIAAFLVRQGIWDKTKVWLWLGLKSGLVLSAVLAWGLFQLGDAFEGNGVIWFEAILFSLSAGLMTHMVFWMQRMSRMLKGSLEEALTSHMAKVGGIGIAFVSALAVAREGAEAVTYLYSITISEQFEIYKIAIAAGLGIGSSLVIGGALQKGIRILNLKIFFKVTSLFLLLSASALVVDAVARFTELELFPEVASRVLWNSSDLVKPDSWGGQTLSLLTGYRATPTVAMVFAILLYWLFIAAISQPVRKWFLNICRSSMQTFIPPRVKLQVLVLAALLGMAWGEKAAAIGYFELEVYPWQTEPPGIIEVEDYFSLSNGIKGTEGNIFRNTIEINYGATEWLEIAVYTDFLRDRKTTDDKLKYAGNRLRGHMSFFEKGELPVDLGAYIEVAFPKQSEKKFETEFKLIAEKDFGRWTVILNPTFEYEIEEEEEVKTVDGLTVVEKEEESETESAWSGAVVYRVSSDWHPSLNLYGNFESGAKQELLIHPKLSFSKLGIPGFQVGIGAAFGLTKATERQIYTGALEYEFY